MPSTNSARLARIRRTDASRFLILILLCALAQPWRLAYGQDRLAAHVAPTEPLAPEAQQKAFQLPPGFEIQLVAAEPQISKPIKLNFDHRGRLYVTQSVEYPYPAAEGQPPRDAVKLVSNIAPNGRAGSVTTFVDRLNIPIGVCPVQGGVLVYSNPQVYFCPDADGDGQADSRRVLYQKFGFADTHGMCSSLTRWLDGWIYACHGFSNTSTVAGSDGQALTMQSGNTFRLRPDGSHAEQFTHGQVNPFGLCFDPLGNLYSADCHSRPVYMLLRGAYYPSFGKPHDGLGFGPEMIRHSHGSTGIAGVAYYAAGQFPAEYRDTLFIGNPITNRINHDRLKRHGATYEAAEQPDFLHCDDPWFRPVDVKVGPDGALYIADFYNGIIGHYEVPLDHPGRDRERGRIWRVVWKGTDSSQAVSPKFVDLTQLALEELVARLGDANLVIRTMATNELVDRFGSDAAGPVRRMIGGDSTAAQRAHGLWVLERLGQVDHALATQLLGDAESLVRVHTLKALAERPAWDDAGELAALVRKRLSDDDAFVRRAAADALGRHPAVENIAPLVALWRSTPPADTHLVHVARMALRNNLAASGMYASVASQIAGDADAQERLANVSLGVSSADAAEYLFSHLQRTASSGPKAEYAHHAARHLAAAKLPAFYDTIVAPLGAAESASSPSLSREAALLRAVSRGLRERAAASPPVVHEAALRLARKLLARNQEPRVREGLELAGEQRLKEVYSEVAAWTAREARFAGLRGAALDSCAAIDAAAAVPLLERLLLDGGEEFALRQKAAQLLAGINSEASCGALGRGLRIAAGPLAVEIAAGMAISRPGAEALVAEIESGKASPRLLEEPAVAGRWRGVQTPELESQRQKLLSGLQPRDARLKQLVDQRRQAYLAAAGQSQANVELGKAVFQKSCAACHKVGGVGNKIGPELDGIGHRGLDRLLEDVLDPNRNVDQAFRSTLLTTTDGRALAGLVLREEGQVLVLADAQGKEVRVAQSEIAERALSPLSPMPANAGEVISEVDFQHLVAFLLSQQAELRPM